MSIEVEGISKLYGSQSALKNVSFKIEKPEIYDPQDATLLKI